MESPLIKLSVTHLLKFADKFAGIEVHVLVDNKFVKLNYPNEQFVDILRKLQQKDVEHVFVNQSDCRLIVSHVTKSLSAKKFYDPKTIKIVRLETLNSAMENVKNIISHIGVDTDTIKLIKTINKQSLSILNESHTIYIFVKEFKKNCSDEFLKAILTNYVMSLVIDKFSWSSDQVKTKVALASFICDVVLSREDFDNLRRWQKKEGALSEKVKHHPEEISRKLRQSSECLPPETITIIEQHHERPDGTGFPHGISSQKFSLLCSIFIVCQQFTEQLHEFNYEYEKRMEIINYLKQNYDYESNKYFRKALNALSDIIH